MLLTSTTLSGFVGFTATVVSAWFPTIRLTLTFGPTLRCRAAEAIAGARARPAETVRMIERLKTPPLNMALGTQLPRQPGGAGRVWLEGEAGRRIEGPRGDRQAGQSDVDLHGVAVDGDPSRGCRIDGGDAEVVRRRGSAG